jgi:nucleoside-diphosphate-sugar epimerase
MNVLVTGAAGMIGAHLLGELSTSYAHNVWAVTRAVTDHSPREGLQWCSLDLTASSWDALPSRADVVVHLAQSPHYRSFPEHALDVFDVNVASTARLLDWAREAGVRQFILASSGGVSQAPVGPVSHYLASKQCAELLAQSYSGFFDVLILRFFFVYGAGQKPWMLVPRLAHTIESDGAISLAGADGPRLNPVYVGDAVHAIERAIEIGVHGTIDIAGPEVLTVRAIGDTIAARLGRRARYACDVDIAPQDLIGDVNMMSSRLVPPRRSFSEGIAEMFARADERAD